MRAAGVKRKTFLGKFGHFDKVDQFWLSTLSSSNKAFGLSQLSTQGARHGEYFCQQFTFLIYFFRAPEGGNGCRLTRL
jgi:hypothetical protein